MVEEDYEPPHLLTPFLTDKAGKERKAILNLEWIYKRLLSLTFHLNEIKNYGPVPFLKTSAFDLSIEEAKKGALVRFTI